MTNLTDKLRKGELLPEGLYWVKHDGVINILDNLEISLTNVDEILDKVPSFEQWQAKLEENTKLKELLKRAKEVLEDEGDYMIVQEINQVLADNKIQANTVACNKIQESE